MDWQNPNHPRANWAKDFRNITSADVGYGIPIFLDEIVGNSNVSLDIKCAMFTNPTKAPLYSRFKMQVTGWFAPISTYVPALRDSVRVDATTDYSFPVINFDYQNIHQRIVEVRARILSNQSTHDDLATYTFGAGLPYVPISSIWSYLRMWPSNFCPSKFVGGTNPESFPQAKNAIPLLMYYDILRNYIINNQDQTTFIRQGSAKPLPSSDYVAFGGSALSSPVDSRITRDALDEMFASIRRTLTAYPQDEPVDISNTLKLYGLYPPNRTVYGDRSASKNQEFVNSLSFVSDYHNCLWRDTYLNDFYTAYISDENVEYERNTAKIVIDPSESLDGETLEFTMEELRIGTMLQNFVRSHIFDNGDFADYVDVEYGCKPPRLLSKPMFMGAISSYLSFNDVIANAQTGADGDILANEALGSRAAVGQGHMFTGKYRGKDKHGKYERSFIKFHASEPGYLMLILTIKPEVAYFEGYDALFDKHSIFDLYRPSFAEIGYQDKCVRHANLLPSEQILSVTFRDGSNQAVGAGGMVNYSDYDIAYAYEPYGFEYMGKPNIITGQMVEKGTYRHWTNARSFNQWKDNFNSAPFRDAYSTTINPEEYHYIFANTQNLDNFQFFFDFDYNVYQPVPHKILSFK